MTGLVSLYEQTPESSVPVHLVRSQGEGGIYKAGGEPSTEAHGARTLTSDFQPPELGEDKLLLLKPPIWGILSQGPQ